VPTSERQRDIRENEETEKAKVKVQLKRELLIILPGPSLRI